MLDTDGIKQRREALGLSMAAAAKLAGCKSAQHWFNVESGQRKNPTLDTIKAVARALGCDYRDLLKPDKRKRTR